MTTQVQAFEGIQFIQMGGTIDKCYPATETTHGYNFEIGSPAFTRILERVAPDGSRWDVWLALREDSLDITDKQRQAVRRRISNNNFRKIVITHGTDTIRKTAEVLSVFGSYRTIVLTGAMQPELFRDSDADFNLGMAVAAVKILPPGVYIALSANVVSWEEYTP